MALSIVRLLVGGMWFVAGAAVTALCLRTDHPVALSIVSAVITLLGVMAIRAWREDEPPRMWVVRRLRGRF